MQASIETTLTIGRRDTEFTVEVTADVTREMKDIGGDYSVEYGVNDFGISLNGRALTKKRFKPAYNRITPDQFESIDELLIEAANDY